MNVNAQHFLSSLAILLALATSAVACAPPDDVMKIGMIGLDTSHSTHFTEALNDPDNEAFAGFRVTAAYPKGSRTIKSSYERIPKYTKAVKEHGVEIVESIDALLDRVDAVLLETNDGRPHFRQAMKVFKAGKPVFIDKPLAASLADAVAIYQAAERYDVPVFSASSLRYIEGAQAVRHGSIGEVVGANAYSAAVLEETHPDLYWYGIHGVETLFTVMGTGCRQVQRTYREGTDVVVGTWEGGRIGVFRGIRDGDRGFGGTAFGTKSIADLGPWNYYPPLLKRIVKFFRTGESPVSPEETLEIYAFMTAAERSKYQNGAPVRLDDVLADARRTVATSERFEAVRGE